MAGVAVLVRKVNSLGVLGVDFLLIKTLQNAGDLSIMQVSVNMQFLRVKDDCGPR